jgi:uncharacterized protein (TIGR02284 family)
MRMADQTHDVEVLDTLTSTLTDSIEGYEQAAEVAKRSGLGSVLQRKARERSVISRRFRQRIMALGGKPTDAAAAAHRRFLNLRSLFEENTKAAVAEVERGEEYLRERFESCQKDPELASETKALLSGAYDRVKFDPTQWDQLKSVQQ